MVFYRRHIEFFHISLCHSIDADGYNDTSYVKTIHPFGLQRQPKELTYIHYSHSGKKQTV